MYLYIIPQNYEDVKIFCIAITIVSILTMIFNIGMVLDILSKKRNLKKIKEKEEEISKAVPINISQLNRCLLCDSNNTLYYFYNDGVVLIISPEFNNPFFGTASLDFENIICVTSNNTENDNLLYSKKLSITHKYFMK